MKMDLDVVMPLCVDSEERVLNARKVAEWMPHLNIIVAQCGPQFHALEFPDNVTCVYLHSKETHFNKCRAMNFGYKFARNSIVMQIDADCLLHHDDIFNAYELIRTDKADFVFPFNGQMLGVPRHYHHLEILKQIIEEQIKPADLELMNINIFGHGGAFMFRWRAFYQYGMENESLSGYGAEDTERWLRLLRFNLEIPNGKHPFFHLNHVRPHTAWYRNDRHAQNKQAALWWQRTDSNIEALEKLKQLREEFDPGQIFA